MLSKELTSQVFLKALCLVAALVAGVGAMVVLGARLLVEHGYIATN